MLLAMPPPVLGVASAPLPGALQAGLQVFRVRGKFLPTIVGATALLAFGLTTNRLTRLKPRLEAAFPIAASPFHTGGCRTRTGRPSGPEGFRSCCRFNTASPPMAHF